MNQKGFGLIEVLIAAAILSVVMLGTAQAINNALLVSQTADVKANLNSLVMSTAAEAINNDSCTTAMTKISQSYNDSLRFNNILSGAVLSSYTVSVDNLLYSNPTLVSTGYDGTKIYKGTLTLATTATKAIIGNKALAARTIANIYIMTTPAGIILQCGGTLPVLPSQPVSDPESAFIAACTAIGGAVTGGICKFHRGAQ